MSSCFVLVRMHHAARLSLGERVLRMKQTPLYNDEMSSVLHLSPPTPLVGTHYQGTAPGERVSHSIVQSSVYLIINRYYWEKIDFNHSWDFQCDYYNGAT